MVILITITTTTVVVFEASVASMFKNVTLGQASEQSLHFSPLSITPQTFIHPQPKPHNVSH